MRNTKLIKNLDFKIIPFDETHIDEIFEIEKLCFATPWTIESLNGELHNAFAKYFVAVCDNKVIGYAGIWNIIDEGHITNIAVHPDYRSCGVGNSLLNKLIQVCKGLGIFSLTLEVRKSNINAQKLYEKHGFIVEGMRKRYYSDNDEDALIMWKHHL